MKETSEHNSIEPQGDPLMDTQRLLGMEPPAEGDFDLEEILAEFAPRPVPSTLGQEPAE